MEEGNFASPFLSYLEREPVKVLVYQSYESIFLYTAKYRLESGK